MSNHCVFCPSYEHAFLLLWLYNRMFPKDSCVQKPERKKTTKDRAGTCSAQTLLSAVLRSCYLLAWLEKLPGHLALVSLATLSAVCAGYHSKASSPSVSHELMLEVLPDLIESPVPCRIGILGCLKLKLPRPDLYIVLELSLMSLLEKSFHVICPYGDQFSFNTNSGILCEKKRLLYLMQAEIHSFNSCESPMGSYESYLSERRAAQWRSKDPCPRMQKVLLSLSENQELPDGGSNVTCPLPLRRSPPSEKSPCSEFWGILDPLCLSVAEPRGAHTLKAHACSDYCNVLFL